MLHQLDELSRRGHIVCIILAVAPNQMREEIDVVVSDRGFEHVSQPLRLSGESTSQVRSPSMAATRESSCGERSKAVTSESTLSVSASVCAASCDMRGLGLVTTVGM